LKKTGDTWTLDKAAFETVTGVGINITDADIEGWLNE
jgi:hypothetical protein